MRGTVQIDVEATQIPKGKSRFDCTILFYFTQYHHLQAPFQLPLCRQYTFHPLPSPQIPFSTAPVPSKHISPCATTFRQGSCRKGARKWAHCCNGLALHSFAHCHDLRKKLLGYLWLFELQAAARGWGRRGNDNGGLSALPAVFAPTTSCPLTFLLVVHLTCMIPGSICICHSHSQGKGASCHPSSCSWQLLGWHLALDFLPH